MTRTFKNISLRTTVGNVRQFRFKIMSPKASSDFGLYKEKQKENKLKSLKFLVVAVITVLFLLMVLSALLHVMNNGSQSEIYESSLEKPTPKAEKLILSQSVKREIFQNTPPKPFGITYRSQPPSEFTSTTEKMTTLNYPQVNTFPHRYYPNNIQDVIGYANRLKPVIKYNRNYKHSPSQNVLQNKRSAKNLNFHDSDPFYFYKPQDPGDINLLATTGFRFAPPAWSNLKINSAKIYSPIQQYYGNTKRQEVLPNNHQKPVSVTLNIYPNEENGIQHRYGLKPLINHRIENLKSKIFVPENTQKKMVIHLNLYPDDLSGGGSNLHANVLTSQTVN